MNDELYVRLEQFAAEAGNSRKEAYEESVRRKKAEKDVIDSIRRVKFLTVSVSFFFPHRNVVI